MISVEKSKLIVNLSYNMRFVITFVDVGIISCVYDRNIYKIFNICVFYVHIHNIVCI